MNWQSYVRIASTQGRHNLENHSNDITTFHFIGSEFRKMSAFSYPDQLSTGPCFVDQHTMSLLALAAGAKPCSKRKKLRATLLKSRPQVQTQLVPLQAETELLRPFLGVRVRTEPAATCEPEGSEWVPAFRSDDICPASSLPGANCPELTFSIAVMLAGLERER